MAILHCRGAVFAHGGAPPLFNNVDFTLTPGWYGLVGANGAGKTTLLALIAQSLAPVAGSIDWVPKSRHVAQCLQLVPQTATGALQTFAEAQDRASRIVRDRLRLDIEALQRWTSLSFGGRKCWQIGAVLAQEPDVLLLDEPTNHLDAPGRDILLSALRNFRGVGVVVSHDRALLNALTHKTLRIAHKQVSMLPARYGRGAFVGAFGIVFGGRSSAVAIIFVTHSLLAATAGLGLRLKLACTFKLAPRVVDLCLVMLPLILCGLRLRQPHSRENVMP